MHVNGGNQYHVEKDSVMGKADFFPLHHGSRVLNLEKLLFLKRIFDFSEIS